MRHFLLAAITLFVSACATTPPTQAANGRVEATGDAGCRLSVEPMSPRGDAFLIKGESFVRTGDITVVSRSDGEVIEHRLRTSSDGAFTQLIFPAVKGKSGGTSSLMAADKSCSVTVHYKWGGDMMQRAEPGLRDEMAACGQHQREPVDRYLDCMRLGARAYEERRYADAERIYLAGIERAQGLGEASAMMLEWNYTLLGDVYYAQRKYTDAERAFQRAIEMLGTGRGTGRWLPIARHALGRVHLAQGKYAEAETHLKGALDVRERALGPGHPDVAATLDDLAILYHATGRPGKGAEAEARARAIRAAPR